MTISPEGGLAPPPSYGRFVRQLDGLLAGAGIAPLWTGGARGRRLPGFYLEAGRGVSGRIRRVQTYVEVHIGKPLRLDDLAEVAGLSRYHFTRVFREETGQTPWRYVRQSRVARAKRLLREGRTPAEAAHEAGFFDQAHLTRAFREFDGRTPGAFREAPPAEAPSGEAEAPPAEDRKDVQDA